MKKSDYIANILKGVANEIETAAYTAAFDLDAGRALILSAKTLRTVAAELTPPEIKCPPVSPDYKPAPPPGSNGKDGGSKVPRQPVKPQGSPPAFAKAN